MKLKSVALVAAIVVPVALAFGIFFTAWAASGTLHLPASADPYGLTVRQAQTKPGESTSRNVTGFGKAALFVCPFH